MVIRKYLRFKASSLVNDQQESAIAYYLKNAERLTPRNLHTLFAKWRPCQAARKCSLNRLKYLGTRRNETERSSFGKCEGLSVGTAERKPLACPKPMNVESLHRSDQQSAIEESMRVEDMLVSNEGILPRVFFYKKLLMRNLIVRSLKNQLRSYVF